MAVPVSAQDVRVRTLDVVSAPNVTRGIPESLRHPNPRERGNYPWLDEVGIFSEEAINGYIETYGAFEFAFEPALQVPNTITWTRFEVIAPEGIDYHFVSEREDFISILTEIERLVHLLTCTMQPYLCN